MGVLGLQPFLQKNCPQVFRTLPERVRDFAGKTIVFDGTLVTQRFHFANAPHEYRHVLGWYRTVQELRAANVKAICIFDGKQRSAAKKAETERRRAVRSKDAARGNIEANRLQRLSDLNKVLVCAQELPSNVREKVFAAMSSQDLEPLDGAVSLAPPSAFVPPTPFAADVDIMTARPRPLPPFADYSVDESRPEPLENRLVELEIDASSETVAQTDLAPVNEDDIMEVAAPDGQREEALEEAPEDIPADTPVVAQEPADDVELEELPTSLAPASVVDSSLHEGIVSVEAPSALEAVTDVVQKLAASVQPDGTTRVEPAACDAAKLACDLGTLYQEFQRSVPEVQAMDAQTHSLPIAEDPVDAAATHTASKFQKALTAAEGKIWQELAGVAADTSWSQLATDVAALRDESYHMTESYERRSNPPTKKTYDECKEILEALGVPCIVTEGEYEAEALASSIVVQGHADFVASEDTDVLVYEAPLLRNITNRNSSLVVISGAEVRASLGLDRPAFVDFALLLGTDFSRRIKNVGPARAFKFIREHGSIEAILAAEHKYPTPDTYLTEVASARGVFTNMPPLPPPAALVPRSPDERRIAAVLRKYGVEEREYDWERVYDDTTGTAIGNDYFGDRPASDSVPFNFEPFR